MIGTRRQLTGFTAAEREVANQARRGKVARFNRPDDPDDPGQVVNWEGRTVRAEALRELIAPDSEILSPIHRRGLRISGARVTGLLDLRDTDVAHNIGFERCLVADGVDLTNARTGSIALVRSRVGDIAARELTCRGNLEIQQSAIESLDLTDAHVAGNVNATTTYIPKGLLATNARFVGDVEPNEVMRATRPKSTLDSTATDDVPSTGSSSEAAPTDPTEPAAGQPTTGQTAAPRVTSIRRPPMSVRLAATGRAHVEPIAPTTDPQADPVEVMEPPIEPDHIAPAAHVPPAATADPEVAPAPAVTPHVAAASSAPHADDAKLPGSEQVDIEGDAEPTGTEPSWFRLLEDPLAYIALGVVLMALWAVLVQTAPDGVFRADNDGRTTAVACGGDVECFNAGAYAVDTFLPGVDLGQADTWHPDGDQSYGTFFRVTRWLVTMLGWLLTLIALATAVTRLKRR